MAEIIGFQVVPGGDPVVGAQRVCASQGLRAVGEPVLMKEETVVIQDMPLVLRNFIVEAVPA